VATRPIVELSDGDIQFLVRTVDSALISKIETLRDDPDIIDSMMEQGASRVFQRIMLLNENEITTTITPRFLFEVLLRTAKVKLENQGYTIERNSSKKIPVFDSQEVVRFLNDKAVIKYLSNMLTSFSRIQSYTTHVRIRKGISRRIRFNDMDIDSLLRYCQTVDEDQRFKLYKRIADLCLFILGMFPEYVTPGLSYPFHDRAKTKLFGRLRWTAEDYEEEGRRFYKLAGEHRDASIMELSEVFYNLHEKFYLAEKPLNFISEHLLQFRKGKTFPSLSPN